MAAAISRTASLSIDGPNQVDAVFLEMQPFEVAKSGGKFTGKHKVTLTPKRIVLNVDWTGVIGTQVDLGLTINGITKPRKPRMEFEREGRTFHFKFSDFGLPEGP